MCYDGSTNSFFVFFSNRFEAVPTNVPNLTKVHNNNKRAIMNKSRINPVPALVSVCIRSSIATVTYAICDKSRLIELRQIYLLLQTRSNELKLAPISSLTMKPVNSVQRVQKLCPNVVVSNTTTGASPSHDSSALNAQKKTIYKIEQPQLVASAPSITTAQHSIASTTVNSNASATPTTITTSVAPTAVSLASGTLANKSNLVTISRTSLNDIMRQLVDVKKQTEDLRKQMDLYQKQNEDYRIRLEKLEKEREDGTRQYTNSHF